MPFFDPKCQFSAILGAGGKSVDLKYKFFGQVDHNIIGTKDLKGSK